MIKEWPLILYTILAQAAAGMFLVAMALRTVFARSDKAEAIRLTEKAMFWTGPVLFVAMIASVFHLGDPLGAIRAVRHVATSWLSREILMTALFFVAWAVGAWLDSRRKEAGAPTWWHWVTAVIGLAMVFVMSMAYMTVAVPAWSSFYTLVSFYATVLLVGALVEGLFVVAAKAQEIANPMLVGIGLICGAVAAVVLLSVPLYFSRLGVGVGPAPAALALLTGSLAWAEGVRLVFVAAAGGLLGLFIWWRVRGQNKPIPAGVMYAALCVAIVGEALGRYLFYATGAPIGPG